MNSRVLVCGVRHICPRLGSWGGSCRLSLTGGGAALQLESDVRFQFETLKPKAPKVGWGAPRWEPVRSGLRVTGIVFSQLQNPCWLGFDLCQMFRSAGRGLTDVRCFAARGRISVLAFARRSGARGAPSTGAAKAARGNARGRRSVGMPGALRGPQRVKAPCAQGGGRGGSSPPP